MEQAARAMGTVAPLEPMRPRGAPAAVVLTIEVTDPEVDIFDRETVFLERSLAVIVKRYPELKIVLE